MSVMTAAWGSACSWPRREVAVRSLGVALSTRIGLVHGYVTRSRGTTDGLLDRCILIHGDVILYHDFIGPQLADVLRFHCEKDIEFPDG